MPSAGLQNGDLVVDIPGLGNGGEVRVALEAAVLLTLASSVESVLMPQQGRIDDARDDVIEHLGYYIKVSTNGHPIRTANTVPSEVGLVKYSEMGWGE